MTEMIFALILFILSGIIAIGLLYKKNMWWCITAYWITQVIRYAVAILSKL